METLGSKRARNYTPKVSALIHCIRLCMLERILPRFAHPRLGWDARPRVGGLKRFIRIHDRLLCHGCQSPASELLSLRSYGRVLCRSDGPSFRVEWDRDEQAVRWKGGRMTMEQLRCLGKTALGRARRSMDRLLYGLDPNISLDDLQDKMSSHRQGYYFVKESANGLDGAYLELLSKACLHPGDGLMSAEVWKLDAVRRFLKQESSLLTNIMLMMYLRGGQAPRTTEFLSIECWNGPTTSRGIYIHRGSLVYVTRHSKARRMTNHEFHIARYLPQEDSRLVATYLAVVRPFAEMLNRVCLGRERERGLMFSHADNVDKHWTSDMLTTALKSLTQDVLQQAFGVQIYRQLSIAVTERQVKQINRPFSLNDDKSIAADIEVVFAWQSGHRPVQRGSSYGIDAAYPDSLQPALLRVYEWASKEWHQFLRVDQRSSNSKSDVVPHDGEQTSTSQKRRATDLAEIQPSKRTWFGEDDETPTTQETNESQAVHSHSLPEPRSLPRESSISLARDADGASAASRRRKDGPVLSPPTVTRRSVVANPPSPPILRQNVEYESLTARDQSRVVGCSREGHPDSDYETVPESPAAERMDDSGLSVQLFGNAGEDLLKDAKDALYGGCDLAWLASYLTGVNVSWASYQAALRAGPDPSLTLIFMMSNSMAVVMSQLQCYALPPNLWRVQYNDSQAQFRDGNLVATLWWYDPHDETEFRQCLLSHLSWGHSQRDSPSLSMLDDRNEAIEWGKARYRWYDGQVGVFARAKVYRIDCRLLQSFFSQGYRGKTTTRTSLSIHE